MPSKRIVSGRALLNVLTMAIGSATPLASRMTYSMPQSRSSFRNCYAVRSDGQRFLVVTFDEEVAPQPIHVLVNWTAQLEP